MPVLHCIIILFFLQGFYFTVYFYVCSLEACVPIILFYCRTCEDINECEMFKDRRLCIGYCVNQPGSYSCQCPQGYRLGLEGATCQGLYFIYNI